MASDILVFSHLKWHSVFQRPHHLLSRLSHSQRVVFIEEPVYEENTAGHWKYEYINPRLIVCTPLTSCKDHGFSPEQLDILHHMIGQLVKELTIAEHIAWFYTPMALPLVEFLTPSSIVYDCMDALDMFMNAHPLLTQREEQLLKKADVVFTGGPSLFQRIKSKHHNVHCFPSSVDATHFRQALQQDIEPDDQRLIVGPKLGFFGVIDERIDLEILDGLAKAHPEWQIIMIGPVVKISTESLPRHPNIHYLGKRDYKDLPKYASGWDVCIMPFALNDATKYISPTKVLEYMATERPIVSTRITDVEVPYGEIVHLGNTPEEFIEACESAFLDAKNEKSARVEAMRDVLSRTSWDRTVQEMQKNIFNQFNKSDKRVAGDSRASLQQVLHPFREAGVDPVVIIGGGPTGLSAAYHLKDDSILLEKNETVGGWCRSINVNGFTFDFAGHIMFSNDPYVHEMYEMLLGDNIHWQDREAWIYSKNVYTRYPFQGALYGLPNDVIKECIIGAIEARYGTGSMPNKTSNSNGHASGNGVNGNIANAQPNSNGHSSNVRLPTADRMNNLNTCNKDLKDCCADGLLESTAPLQKVSENGNHIKNGHSANGHNSNGHAIQTHGSNGVARSENFEEFIYRVWGRGIAKHFAIPYNRKLWALPLTEMETSWLGGRVPMPDLEEMIDGALHPVPKPMGPNARFGYPLRGGFQSLMNGFLPHIKDQICLGVRTEAVSPSQKTITTNVGTTIKYNYLVSTMPLPILIRSMGDEAPKEVQNAASKLRYLSVRCVHLGIGRENLTEKHWIYYPEDTIFHRIFVQGNTSPHCNPQGGTGLTCEITYSPYKPLPCDGEELTQLCIDDCQRVGVFKADDPIWAATQVDLPYAYVIYDHERQKNVKLIRDWLATQNIILAGRYSEWEYYNSDHAFIAGKKAADLVKEKAHAGSQSTETVVI